MDDIAMHGGDIYSYMEMNGAKPLDYSANINPLGLPDNVKKALAQSIESYSAYPDTNCRKLKEAVSAYEKFEAGLHTVRKRRGRYNLQNMLCLKTEDCSPHSANLFRIRTGP